MHTPLKSRDIIPLEGHVTEDGMRNIKVLLAAGALTAAGCTGDDGGGGGGRVTVDPETLGGFVIVGAAPDAALLFGEFYSDVTYTPSTPEPFVLETTDECVEDPDDDEIEQTNTYLDVGPEISATAGDFTLIAARDTSDGITYGTFASVTTVAGAEYTVSVAGAGDVAAGSIGTISVPTLAAFTGGGEAPPIVPGEDLELEFTPETGADFVVINLGDFDGTVSFTCVVEDDGAFTVPAAITAVLGSNGDIDLQNANIEQVSFEGRDVFLQGIPLD